MGFRRLAGLRGIARRTNFVRRTVRDESKRHGDELKFAVPDESHGLRMLD